MKRALITNITGRGGVASASFSYSAAMETLKNAARETLKKAASGMKRKVHGAQRPRHNNELGEAASTAQRSDSPAQQFIQRFPRGMKRTAHRAQRPRHVRSIGSAASTVQRSGSSARQFIQCFSTTVRRTKPRASVLNTAGIDNVHLDQRASDPRRRLRYGNLAVAEIQGGWSGRSRPMRLPAPKREALCQCGSKRSNVRATPKLWVWAVLGESWHPALRSDPSMNFAALSRKISSP